MRSSYDFNGIGIYAGNGSISQKKQWGKTAVKSKIIDRTPIRIGKPTKEGSMISATLLNIKRKNLGVMTIQGMGDNVSKLELKFDDEALYNVFWISFPLEPSAHIFGCGDISAGPDLRGKVVPIWNDCRGNQNNANTYSQPTFFIAGREKSFVHVNGTGYMEFDFSGQDAFGLFLTEKVSIYFCAEESFEKLFQKMGALLGKASDVPEWVMVAQPDDESENGSPKREPLISVSPLIEYKRDEYNEALEKGFFIKDKKNKVYKLKIGKQKYGMVDFTNQTALLWLKERMKAYLVQNKTKLWIAAYPYALPADCCLFDGTDAVMMHNKWADMWLKLNRDILEEGEKEGLPGEALFLAEAGYTDSVKMASIHALKCSVSFDRMNGLSSIVQALISLSMTGKTLLTLEKDYVNQGRTDTEADRRFLEITEFLPFCSHHNAMSGYMQTLIRAAVNNGIPIVRPLFYISDERAAYDAHDEYLLGNDVLVAPVIERGATSKQVFLPQDNWVHLWSHKEYEGGMVTVEAMLGKPPVFIRKSSMWRSVLEENFNKLQEA